MLRIELHPEAKEELGDAAEYYDEARPGWGEKFVTDFWTAINGLREYPQRWPIREYGFRKYTLQSFRHNFRYIERNEYIYVIAVPHGSRKPGYWKKRISDEQR